jgi:HD-GYP domain-containing protein (c-di-GMP phosphodiesterase class II)
MMRDRPYRKAMKRDEAFAELECHAGTQFDPEVVATLIAVEHERSA